MLKDKTPNAWFQKKALEEINKQITHEKRETLWTLKQQ